MLYSDIIDVLKIFSLLVGTALVLEIPIGALGFLISSAAKVFMTLKGDKELLKRRVMIFGASVAVNVLVLVIFAVLTNTGIYNILSAIWFFLVIDSIPLVIFFYLVVSIARLSLKLPDDKEQLKKKRKPLLICTVIVSILLMPVMLYVVSHCLFRK